VNSPQALPDLATPSSSLPCGKEHAAKGITDAIEDLHRVETLGPYRIQIEDCGQDEQAELMCHAAQGKRIQFTYADASAARARYRLQSNVLTLTARTCQGRLVGLARLASKLVYWRGMATPAAYFFDRVVHPDHRRQGLGRALLRAQLALARSVPLCYALVLEDNTVNRRVLEAQGLVCFRRPLTYFAIVTRWCRRQGRLALAMTTDEAGTQLEACLKSDSLFLDSIARAGDWIIYLPGWAGQVEAGAAIYELAPRRLAHAPWYLRGAMRWLPGLPRWGELWKVWLISHLWAAGPKHVTRLVHSLGAFAYRRGVHLLIVPLEPMDPCWSAVRALAVDRWPIMPLRACFYYRSEVPLGAAAALGAVRVSGRDH